MTEDTDYLVSFVIPVFNAEKTIDRCIKSIMKYAKAYHYEVLLIDDGSKDKSRAICERYCEKYDNIKYYYIDNSGPANARNVGKNKALGKYVTFVDSDDYYLKGLEKILCKISDSEYDVYRAKYPGDKSTIVSVENVIGNKIKSYVWLLFIRNELLREVQFNCNYLVYEDLVFYYELVMSRPSISYVDEYTYYHTTSFNSITRTSDRLIKKIESIMLLNKKIFEIKNEYINELIIRTVIDANLDKENYKIIVSTLFDKYNIDLSQMKYRSYKIRCFKSSMRCLLKKAYFKLKLK